MKLYLRHIFRSTVVVALGALLLTTLMLISVDLFANLDTYLSHELPLSTIAYLTLLGSPQAMIFALGPSLLFSATYFLSQLHANNEYICLIGSGIRPLKIILPIIAVGLLASILQFTFAEYVKLPLSKERLVLEEDLFGLRTTQDNRNITLHDPEGRYVLFARHFRAEDDRLREVMLLLFDEQGNLTHRIDARQGSYDEDSGYWRFHGVQSQEVGEVVTTTSHETYDDSRIDLDPSYFSGAGGDIDQMDIQTALHYLHWMKRLDPNRYTPLAADFVKRILDALNPLVLTVIAATIRYSLKKNILLFAIITSLVVAVVYYVVQMVTMIAARQGVLSPIWAMVIPSIVVLLLAALQRTLSRRG
ncbi:MAG: YjgP/YjgQ family permease [Spirochaetales bacterium]|nr:YjgP/YjgQ family permease [Spirochaetales bacterium]